MILLPATQFDFETLARNLRASDVSELTELRRLTGDKGNIRDDVAKTAHSPGDFFSMWLEGQLVGICGVAALPEPGTGLAFFLGTPLADTYERGMTRALIRFIRWLRPRWDGFGNLLPAHMKARRRWLEKLGFDFGVIEAQQLPKGTVAFWLQCESGPKDRPAAPS